MTEHKNIPLPKRDGEDGSTESSLFERASGAFGFDPFKAAPIKGKLPEREMKRAKVKVKDADGREQAEKPAATVEAAPVASPPVPAEYQPEPRETLPVPAASRELVVEPQATSVALSGQKYEIDREFLREQGLIVPEGTITGLIEEFRIVKRQILKAAKDKGTGRSRRVLICSPHPGEGKTFCATNLAIAMAAERDSEVLLIDGDFAKPSILSTLGLPKGPGFMDCLADPAVNPEDLVMGTDIGSLWVLPAGNQTNSDSEYLASERTAEVLDRLTVGAPNRIIIFDSPPALAASPAAELAKHVGQSVLVARADKTGQSALEDACQLLSACPDIKLLLNAAHFSPSGRNFGSYYGYGE
ncbi:capsular biosynthesis protein [Pontixanthobacter aestiaquae]|uniref:Capsular biosynthesis protein n=1 Tax=Pontixanthobacter aestiaquae TaxID=1509367 RepID=A0A844ZA34_9SPHN|nr:capsular biosynthesis protein [Pontixanthobacter aestiaquae]MDN3645278.1 capsular biosynthesis protein [Pontixanthobacter aestiaquae]MXO83720.1 capsular biosynthesis protein [Pontixanthobacter aestiaquae]